MSTPRGSERVASVHVRRRPVPTSPDQPCGVRLDPADAGRRRGSTYAPGDDSSDRDAARLYLLGATQVFLGASGGFRYVREVRRGHHAVLEFGSTIDAVWVNGVDLLTCDDEGRIVDFRVMVRPLKAIDAVHQAMRRLLEEYTGAS